ncbi:MAG: neutral/alkaline non-lysosomal ceramidase N-terminal domain-containing protein [Clostridia bacterium]|nr:neutral/alkaline non-lysosomal ceramidase N-terminal domain-containing protein [Clostridia bacterium]
MAVVIRWISAIMAVLLGLPTLLGAVFQSLTKTGYDERPVAEISENFLEGNSEFIDEAVSEYWSAGYARRVLTPEDIDETRYFLGGYLKFPAQEATGVIDDLYVRAVVLDDNSGRGAAAFAWIDAVGFMNADIKDIREKLSDITGNGKLISIDVGSTHNHSAVDTQGLWGNIPKTGRNQEYIDAVIQKTADAIREAYNNRTEGTLYYSSKTCPEMFYDGRDPYSIDEKIHLFRFVPNAEGKKEIYIANFGAHPVNLGWGNTEISGDYPYYVENEVITEKNADFIFVQGAIGGAIHADMGTDKGIPAELTSFEKTKEYSKIVADILYELAEKGEAVEPILNVKHAQVDFEVNNFIFLLAERAGLCNVKAFKEDGKVYLTSEIGYVEIGKNVKIVEAPGEVMPEIIYGGFYSAEEAYNGTEYPYEGIATRFGENDEVLVFGLCNDAVGYIVPDNDYSASNEEGHYEETVSTGSKSATAFSKAVFTLLEEVN